MLSSLLLSFIRETRWLAKNFSRKSIVAQKVPDTILAGLLASKQSGPLRLAESVRLLDAAEDLLEPVHPDFLSHGFECFYQFSGSGGIFSGIGNKPFCHTTPLIY
jgi:hypothetical protein